MIKLLTVALFLFPLVILSQDKKPVQIFSSEKAINANTTEIVSKGKLAFKVTHNFGDIAGDNGGASRFFGLDNSADIRIAFTAGLANRLDVTVARAKGAGPRQQLYELGLKYQLMQQLENNPSHPLAVTFFANNVIAANKANPFPNQDNSYTDFSDRLSNVLQLIIARKMGKISVQLNPTLVTRGYAVTYDKKTMFALGGAVRVPLGGRVNMVVDYFHPFRDAASKDAFKTNENISFSDPLGLGFELLTAGHVFRLNFTNSTEILENRFIPRTVTSWGEGQFRWGFTITRNFTLWR